MHQFLNLIFGIKLYMFRTVPLSIIRSFSPYIFHLTFILILIARRHQNLCDIYRCCVYSEKLLMMERGTVRNM